MVAGGVTRFVVVWVDDTGRPGARAAVCRAPTTPRQLASNLTVAAAACQRPTSSSNGTWAQAAAAGACVVMAPCADPVAQTTRQTTPPTPRTKPPCHVPTGTRVLRVVHARYPRSTHPTALPWHQHDGGESQATVSLLPPPIRPFYTFPNLHTRRYRDALMVRLCGALHVVWYWPGFVCE